MPAVKITTCNYCGTRAALVLSGNKRHELACSNCGAPLHDLKIMPRPQHQAAAKPKRPSPAPSHTRAMSKQRKYDRDDDDYHHRRRKKKKSFGRRALEEIWDFVEDIFD